MRYEKVHVRVDDAVIAAGDLQWVMEPVWWWVTIYEGSEEYERTLTPFSRAQRYVFALLWYRAEVENGGHKQFYSNSTGIVWRDAIEACHAVGQTELAEILRRSAERLGGSPSLDRRERNRQLEALAPDFADVDKLFYELALDFDEIVMSFIRSRPADFYFEGTIGRAVPGSG